MSDNELIEIYTKSYKDQYDEFFVPFNEIYLKAIDKQYAIQIHLGFINLIGGLIMGSDLDNKVNDLYEHSIKLGGNVTDVINEIPKRVEFYKQEQNYKEEKNENKVSITWKRFFGIPYKIEKINAKIIGKLGSSYEYFTEKSEIAKHLGKQRAIVDLRKQILGKFIEHGGLKELSKEDDGNILPIKFKTLNNLKESLSKNDLVEFFKILQGVFATLSYDMKITEGYFHSHIHLILTLLDFDIHSEVETNQGRIDAVIESENYIHIIEFKHKDSDIALEQILIKKYYQKYFLKNKKVILVGVAVDKTERNIIDWKMKSYK